MHPLVAYQAETGRQQSQPGSCCAKPNNLAYLTFDPISSITSARKIRVLSQPAWAGYCGRAGARRDAKCLKTSSESLQTASRKPSLSAVRPRADYTSVAHMLSPPERTPVTVLLASPHLAKASQQTVCPKGCLKTSVWERRNSWARSLPEPSQKNDMLDMRV